MIVVLGVALVIAYDRCPERSTIRPTYLLQTSPPRLQAQDAFWCSIRDYADHSDDPIAILIICAVLTLCAPFVILTARIIEKAFAGAWALVQG